MSESIDTESIPDYRYFKFRSINKHLIESLVNSSLYFAKPDRLNDPFDCQLDLHKSFTQASSSATGIRKDWLQGALDTPGLLKSWRKKYENVGVCSFSLGLNNTLLWSHYADEHRGLCLLYRLPESFLSDPKNILGVDTVKYSHNALTDWLKNDASMELNTFLNELPRMYLTAKSPAWKYENEARIIRPEHGILKIPFGFLEQVCFGLRTPQADIDLVTKLAREYCGCEKFCRIIRDESDFGITAEAI